MSQIIYGKNPVLEAIKTGLEFEKIYVLNTMSGEIEVTIRQFCNTHNIPLAKVPENKCYELSRSKAHQGVVAIVSLIKYAELSNILSTTEHLSTPALYVVIDEVTDVRNIGAIVRSAYYFGAHAIFISMNGSARINQDTIKASAGALLSMPIVRYKSIFTLLASFQNNNIVTIATSMEGEPCISTDLTHPSAILFGNEERGLHPKVLSVVDVNTTIQGVNGFDSLNVSVAAGILLHETIRQRSLLTPE